MPALAKTKNLEVPSAPDTKRRSLTDRIQDLINRFWLLELFACILSWIIIAIIAAGLNHLDNKSVLFYAWSGYSNTILVLLSTILRAALMIPVVGSIAQLKWHHFRGSNTRGLDELETFSDATGGSIGALKLLMMFKFTNFASVGAALTILAFFVPTLTQQALATINGAQSNSESWVQRNSQYTMTTLYRREDGLLLPPSEVTNAFLFSMSTNASNELNSFQTGLWSCDSANCDYPTYQSLGVESQCVDLTSQLSSESVVAHPSDPSLLMNSNTAVNSTTIIFTPPPEGLYPDPVGLLLARWLVLGRSVGLNPTSDIIAAECVFYWAVHTYNASVTSNSVSESIVGTSVNFEKNSTRKLPALNDGEQATVPWSYIIRPDPCYVNGMIVSASDARCAFSVWGDAHTGLRNYLGLEGGSSLRGAATVQNNGQENRTFDYNSQFIFFMLGRFGNADVGQMFDRVQMIAGQGSQMLTTQVRQQPISGNSPQTYVFDRVFGTQIFQFAIYSARWAYMAYPIALTTLATLFFGITTFRTRNEPKWKNSVLAFLFHGLVHEDMVRHGEVPTIVGMRAASEGLLVKLADTQHGEKLVSKDLLSTGHTS